MKTDKLDNLKFGQMAYDNSDEAQAFRDSLQALASKEFKRLSAASHPVRFSFDQAEERPLVAHQVFDGGQRACLPFSFVKRWVQESVAGLVCRPEQVNDCQVVFAIDWNPSKMQWLVSLRRVSRQRWEAN